MTDKITLTTIGSLTANPTSAQTNINSNFSTIQTAMDNTLSRDGTQPNSMGNNLDMNSNQILNLPAPATADSPVRLTDLNTIIGGGTIQTIPAGGTTGQVLDKISNTDYAVQWTSSPTLSSIHNTGTLTLPTSTDTLVGRATTDTLTNKTLTNPIIGGITGGSAANSGVNIVSTSNGTPSGDSINIEASVVRNFNPVNGQPSVVVAGNPGSPANLLLCGTTGNTTLITASSASGTITVPSATDQLVCRATTDTLTNKTIAAGSNTITGLTVSTLGGVTGSANSTTFLRGDNTWNTPSAGTIVFLETLTASTSTTLSTSVSWAGFSSIVFSINNLLPSAASNNLQFQVNAGGVQASSYLCSTFGTSGSATIVTNAPTTYIACNALALTATILSGEIKLLNPAGAGSKDLIGTTTYGSTFGTAHVGGRWTGATAVTAAQFSLTTGTMTSGTIRVYGIV